MAFKEKWLKFRDSLDMKSLVIGLIIGVGAATYADFRMNERGFFDRMIPTNEVVHKDYVAPSGIEEIAVKSLDEKELPKTYMKLLGTYYPLKWIKARHPYLDLDLDQSDEFEQCLEKCISD